MSRLKLFYEKYGKIEKVKVFSNLTPNAIYYPNPSSALWSYYYSIRSITIDTEEIKVQEEAISPRLIPVCLICSKYTKYNCPFGLRYCLSCFEVEKYRSETRLFREEQELVQVSAVKKKKQFAVWLYWACRQVFPKDTSKIIWNLYYQLDTTKEYNPCAVCESPTFFWCKDCKNRYYCSKKCQTLDWDCHKVYCKWFKHC